VFGLQYCRVYFAFPLWLLNSFYLLLFFSFPIFGYT
jgi:hypothetical protein